MKIFDLRNSDSDKYDFKMVAIAAIMVAIFNMVAKNTYKISKCSNAPITKKIDI